MLTVVCISALLLLLIITFLYFNDKNKTHLKANAELREKIKKSEEQLAGVSSSGSSWETEKSKFEEKNKKLWQMSEVVHREKKKVDEANEKLIEEKEKLGAEKKKIEEKVKKLWQTSTAIHKEKERINELKLEIEHKHQEIIDSVNYAKRIQEAILPAMDEIERTLPHSFVFFQPRDIVSGDFYWFSRKENCAYIAAVDCTGHGVPGAFMSMIGNTLLNQIVNEKEISDPGEILFHLNAAINYSLKQAVEGAESKDGMDIALVKIIQAPQKGIVVNYAGANRPFYHVKPKENNEYELIEYKASKFPIGGYDHERNKAFQTNTIHLNKGETFYIFTDGYADQFGGPKGKKFMLRNFQILLCDIQQHGMDNQKEIIKKNINDWKQAVEQVDDILVIGIKV